MTNTRAIILNNLSFHIDNTPVNFTNINLSFDSLKYGIVGDNGVGKSTFLNVLLGNIIPDSGMLHTPKLMAVPQSHTFINKSATIAEALMVEHLLSAIRRIKCGGIDETDFEILADYWDIEQRVRDALRHFDLWPIDLNSSFHCLSAGQKTKVLLAKTRIFSADFLLFDEPTNNLDSDAREILYHYIENASQGIIVVSHDRKLLNICDVILEITTKGIEVYGGNYDFYHEQKQIKKSALAHDLQAQKAQLNKSKAIVQNRLEKHAQGEARGRKKIKQQIKAKGQYNKIEMNSKKGKSENSNRRIRQQADRKLTNIREMLQTTQMQLEKDKPFSISLANTAVSNNKCVLKIEALNFCYPMQTSLINNVNFDIIGASRVAIIGNNGSGKSTLIKLIRGILKPQQGSITMGVNEIVYLDQSVSLLAPEQSLVANYLRLNPSAKPFDAYAALAAFKFRNTAAEKIVSCLSGGEKMRAGLAISLMSIKPPQLIILDEPTNHLDLDAIEAVEEALNLYQGAMLVVSHDQQFLENIQITKQFYLSR